MSRPRRLPKGSIRAGRQRTPTGSDTVEYRWEARHVHLTEARNLVSRWLSANRISELASALHLAITELLSNAREASRPTDPITLRLDLAGEMVEVAVENVGEDFEPSFDMPDALAPRGRGLGLVSAVAESVDVVYSRGRTRVAARFRIHTSS